MRFGALLGGLFGASKLEREVVDRVRAWALAALQPADGLAITVNEIVCTDPSCPGIETVILVMAPGRPTRAAKVPKAIEAVTEQDIRAALV